MIRGRRLGNDRRPVIPHLAGGAFRDLLHDELPGGTAILLLLHLEVAEVRGIQGPLHAGGWIEDQTRLRSRGDWIIVTLDLRPRSAVEDIAERWMDNVINLYNASGKVGGAKRMGCVRVSH